MSDPVTYTVQELVPLTFKTGISELDPGVYFGWIVAWFGAISIFVLIYICMKILGPDKCLGDGSDNGPVTNILDRVEFIVYHKPMSIIKEKLQWLRNSF